MGEFEVGDEAGLLVQAAEVTGQVDDGVLFLECFIGQGVIEAVKSLFSLVGVISVHVLVIGIAQQLQDVTVAVLKGEISPRTRHGGPKSVSAHLRFRIMY